MHLSLSFCICMVIFTCLCKAEVLESDENQQDAPTMVTIDAAYSYRAGPDEDFVVLFSGKFTRFLKDTTEAFGAERKLSGVPDDLHLQAAFIQNLVDDVAMYYYGDKYGYRVMTGLKIKVKRFKYGPRRAFIRNGGPDAAGRRSGQVYVFKNCQMAIRNSWYDWGKPQNVKSVGLPCNIDAAWAETGGAMIVLKGDQFWRWESDGSVNGPHAFHDTFTLKDWILKPSEEATQK